MVRAPGSRPSAAPASRERVARGRRSRHPGPRPSGPRDGASTGADGARAAAPTRGSRRQPRARRSPPRTGASRRPRDQFAPPAGRPRARQGRRIRPTGPLPVRLPDAACGPRASTSSRPSVCPASAQASSTASRVPPRRSSRSGMRTGGDPAGTIDDDDLDLRLPPHHLDRRILRRVGNGPGERHPGALGEDERFARRARGPDPASATPRRRRTRRRVRRVGRDRPLLRAEWRSR